MRQGKLTNEQLERLILSKFRGSRPEVVVRPDVGVDCAAVDLGGELCVLSTDPITGAGENIGRLAVHVCCNDAAAAGAEPIGILTTLLLPPEADEELIERIALDVAEAARQAEVDVLGGHTEVTDAVTRPVLSATVIAKCPAGGMINSAGMQAGDDLVMSKWAALEGTAILAADFEQRARQVLSEEELQQAKELCSQLSVCKEGRIAARQGAHALHDITEGGLLGAVWEMAEASECGAQIDLEKVPLLESTRKLCTHFRLNPYKLISSGSMLIACPQGKKLCRALQEAGVPAACIGRALSKEAGVWAGDRPIEPPEADELYRVLQSAQ
jgi:hydrogenase expression/formation protein HypE